MRALPSRVGIYFVLAMALFPGIGYLRVWGKMTAALEGLGVERPVRCRHALLRCIPWATPLTREDTRLPPPGSPSSTCQAHTGISGARNTSQVAKDRPWRP